MNSITKDVRDMLLARDVIVVNCKCKTVPSDPALGHVVPLTKRGREVCNEASPDRICELVHPKYKFGYSIDWRAVQEKCDVIHEEPQ